MKQIELKCLSVVDSLGYSVTGKKTLHKVDQVFTPENYREAISCSKAKEWIQATKEEYRQLLN